ncbi:hypothetical protein AJ88_15820 [Mesorhizobium amorphae CCBAU 01583]|nr:hypothetical protein AJ88_15820 [Mesorhizobium amorphae CCBAU 01583]
MPGHAKLFYDAVLAWSWVRRQNMTSLVRYLRLQIPQNELELVDVRRFNRTVILLESIVEILVEEGNQ